MSVLTALCPNCGRRDTTTENDCTFGSWFVSFEGVPEDYDTMAEGLYGDGHMENVATAEEDTLKKFGVEITDEMRAKFTPQFSCASCYATYDEPNFATPPDEDSEFSEWDQQAFTALVRRTLAGGLTWVQVDARWPTTKRALHDCDVRTLAALDAADVSRIGRKPDVLGSGAKLRQVVTNAQVFCGIADDHGDVASWLAAMRHKPWEDRVTTITQQFKGMRERRAWRWLKEINEPVPEPPPWADDVK